MKRLIALALVTGFWAAHALAAEQCDRPKNDFDNMYCLNKVFLQADSDLNKSYGVLARLITPSARQQLKSTQLQWIQRRNSECSYTKGEHFFVSLDCATQLTIDRTNWLNDRVRECKSSGCQPSKLQ